MASLSQINIKFSADLKGFSSEMQNAMRQIDKVGKQMKDIGRDLSTYVTAPLLLAGGASVKLASDFNESLNKVDVAFKSASVGIKEFAKTTLQGFGIAEGTALDMAALFGDMATSMGLPVDKAAVMSKAMVGLSGDLASFKNIGIDEAVTALNGVFTGETESLKRIGVVMTEANLAAFALSKGIKANIKDMTQAEKVNLRFAYVMEQTKNAQGDFARTSGGAANQMRIFQESLKQVGAQIGAVILPLFTRMITAINDKIKGFSELSQGTKTLIVVIGGLAAAVGPLLLIIGSVVQLIPVLVAGFALLSANIVPIVVAIGVITSLFIIFSGATKQAATATQELTASQKLVGKVTDEATASIVDQRARLETLLLTARNQTESVKEKKKAIEEINRISPEYLGNITLENVNTDNARIAIEKYNVALLNGAKARAASRLLEANEADRIKSGFDREKALAEYNQKRQAAAAQGWEAEKKFFEENNQLLQFANEALDRKNAKYDFEAKILFQIYNSNKAYLKLLEDIGSQQSANNVASNEFKPGTVAFYEKQIEGLRKLQKEIPVTNAAWKTYEERISAIQEKIEKLTSQSVALPPLPAVSDEVLAPAPFSLGNLKEELAYWEQFRDQYSTNAEEYDKITQKINAVKIKISAIEGVEEFKTKMEEVKTFTMQTQEILQAQMLSFKESLIVGFAEGIAALATGAQNIGGFFKGMLGIVGDFMKALGKSLIQVGLASVAFKSAFSNPFAAIGAGAALIVLGSVVKNMLQSGPQAKFANGGIAYGPVNALVGEYSGARSNPEVIAPLSKLKSLISPAVNSGDVAVNLIGQLRLSGSDLLLALERTQAVNNRKR